MYTIMESIKHALLIIQFNKGKVKSRCHVQHYMVGEFIGRYPFPTPPLMQFGPLHTRAKSRDHEIVRAKNKVSKGRPKTPPKSCNVAMDPQM